MAQSMAKYLPMVRHLDVLELGSGTSAKQVVTHRSLLEGIDYSYVGVDVRAAPNVDRVMQHPYSIPARSRSVDVVVSGSVFEHVPFFWASILEIARVLRPNGLLFFTVPSRGHKHSPIDCWRMYPDGIRAIAAASRLTLLDVHTHFPPRTREDNRHDYARINAARDYWGDTVAVFRKPRRYAPSMRLVRPVVRWWANRSSRSGPLGMTPEKPASRCRIFAGGDQPWEQALATSRSEDHVSIP
jgi:SAM-dependent methyltransferase